MPKQTFKVPGEKALLDVVSYGRGGPSGKLSPAQIEHIRRTVQRVPEAMVKVLPRGGNDLKAVARHLEYIDRHGKLPLETDDGERVSGRAAQALLKDWDLDIDDVRRQNDLAPTDARKPPKLVYKLMFSMPAGTPPEKVLDAVRNFAREEFALKHRYAFVLHTDEPHPHVHMVVKAVSEQGVRLNIRKATLRHWRSEFARNLRALGVAANATERAVRGENVKSKKDGIYRAARRGESIFIRRQVESVARDISKRDLPVEPGRSALKETRLKVAHGWIAAANHLAGEGHHMLADEVRQFVDRMPEVRTERDIIAQQLQQRIEKLWTRSDPVR